MAHGLPDYYRGVDIAYQALSELINRPKYGAGNRAYFSKTVTANGLTSLCLVSGKGIIYGGNLHLDYTSTQKLSCPRLYVDGNMIASGSFERANKYNYNVAQSYTMYIRQYDDVEFIYSVAIGYPVTFESSFEIKYLEQNGTTPTVEGEFVYALI